MFKALSEGHRAFRRIAVVADTGSPTAPCGPCRQILWEYAGDVTVVLANLARETARYRMRDLLPEPFDAAILAEGATKADADAPPARGPAGPRPRRSRGAAGGTR
jgi:cytidine deaminase